MRHRRFQRPVTQQFTKVALVAAGVGLWACAESESGTVGRAPDLDAGATGTARASVEETRAETGRSGPRVVVLGTSLTAGMGLADPESQSWAGQLQFLADSTGLAATVVNAGVSGDTSAGGLRRLQWILREPVDVLVVELGANDGLRGQDPEALASNLTAIVEETRSRYPDARVALVQMEAPPNLGPAYVEAFRAVFGQVADATGSTLVPFILDEVAGQPALNQDDGIHPTSGGHALMARAAWPFIAPLIQASRTSP